MSEGGIMRDCMKRASMLGMRLFRNNVGVGLVVRGKSAPHREAIMKACMTLAHQMGGSAAHIRFGLGEGSGDCIGWTPHLVTEADLDKTLAIFTSAEIKTKMGRSSDAQKQHAIIVRNSGGIAFVARSADDVAKNATQNSESKVE